MNLRENVQHSELGGRNDVGRSHDGGIDGRLALYMCAFHVTLIIDRLMEACHSVVTPGATESDASALVSARTLQFC